VEEIRQALRKANILPPYLLVPHSISGLRALYYVNKYPEEISGIVGLDISVPEQADHMDYAPETFNAYELLRVLGVVRVMLMLDPSLSDATSMGLSAPEVSQYNRITNWVVGSHAIFGEGKALLDNLRSLRGQKFPAGKPIVLILSSVSANKKGPGMNGTVWRAMHERIVEGNPESSIVVMAGEHYIHHHNERKVAEIILKMAEGHK